jgi:hypothetical protein
MTWRNDQNTLHYMVEEARALADSHPGQPLYAVGHTPSWLVYAAGAWRKAQGQDRRVGYIPFTGAYLDLPRDFIYKPMPEDRIVPFEHSEYHVVSRGSLDNYFNYLARHRVDPAGVRNRYGADRRPVLVDFLHKGKGFASFLHTYDKRAREQGLGALDADVVVYKLATEDRPVTLALPPHEEGGAPLRVPATVISGPAGVLMNMVSGAQGRPADWELERGDQREGDRFMPYFTLVDSYNQNSRWASYAPGPAGYRRGPQNGETVRSIKAALNAAAAMAVRDPDRHAARAEAGRIQMKEQEPRTFGAPGWVPRFGGGGHGF